MELTEIYSDADGETHFRVTAIDLETRDFAPPSEPVHVSANLPSTSSVFLVAPLGWDKAFHPTPRKQLAVMLKGEATVTASDGDIVEVHPGDILLLNDQNSKGHLTQVRGDQEARFLLVGLEQTD